MPRRNHRADTDALLARDAEYRAALGLAFGQPIPTTVGTVSHGGTKSSRNRARRNPGPMLPRGVRLDAIGAA